MRPSAACGSSAPPRQLTCSDSRRHHDCYAQVARDQRLRLSQRGSRPMTGSAEWVRHAYLRHTWPIRVMHWVNVVVLAILLMSGLQIFNAVPGLYWGKSSYGGRPPVLEMAAEPDANGQSRGITTVLGHEFDTTGVL